MGHGMSARNYTCHTTCQNVANEYCERPQYLEIEARVASESVFSANLPPQPACCHISASLDDDAVLLAAGFEEGSVAVFLWSVNGASVTNGNDCGARSSTGSTDACSMLVMPRKHNGPVHRVELQADAIHRGSCRSSESACLCSGSSDGTLVLSASDSEVQELSPIGQWRGHRKLSAMSANGIDGVSAIGIDGDFIVTGGADSSACIWKRLPDPDCSKFPGIASPVQILRCNDGVHGGTVTAAVVSELSPVPGPSPLVVTGGEDGFVKLWTTDRDYERFHVSKTGPVMCLELDAGFGRLCTGTDDGMVRLYDMSICKATRRFQRAPPLKAVGMSTKAVYDMSFDKLAVANRGQGGETLFATGLSDGEVCMWDTRRRQVLVGLNRHFSPAVEVVLQGRLLLSGSLDGDIYVWDIRCLSQPLMHQTFGYQHLEDFACGVNMEMPVSARGSLTDVNIGMPSPQVSIRPNRINDCGNFSCLRGLV